MSLQVCEHPKCKTLTLMSLCEAHREELYEDEEDEPGEGTDIYPSGATPATYTEFLKVVIDQGKDPIVNGNPCTYPRCEEQSAENSKMCPHHRDQKARANAKYSGRSLDVPKRKYTRRTPTEQAIAPFPAPRRSAPIVLAEPTLVNGRRSEAVTVLDSFISKLESDLATLKGAREVLTSP